MRTLIRLMVIALASSVGAFGYSEESEPSKANAFSRTSKARTSAILNADIQSYESKRNKKRLDSKHRDTQKVQRRGESKLACAETKTSKRSSKKADAKE